MRDIPPRGKSQEFLSRFEKKFNLHIKRAGNLVEVAKVDFGEPKHIFAVKHAVFVGSSCHQLVKNIPPNVKNIGGGAEKLYTISRPYSSCKQAYIGHSTLSGFLA